MAALIPAAVYVPLKLYTYNLYLSFLTDED